MKRDINIYVESVLDHIAADQAMKRRIEKDLLSHVNEVCGDADLSSIIEKMGQPEEVAREFMDNIYEDKEEAIDQLVQERAMNMQLQNNYYEYKSKAEIFGLPLVHIKFSRGYYRRKTAVAKGIIAIGDIAMGAIAIGGIAMGGLCLGGISLGLLSFGGVSIGLLLALGGVAIGGLAIGGGAVGLGAIGGAAFGKIAFGGFAKGVVAIGGKAVGEYIITGTQTGDGSYTLGYVSKQQIADLIRMAYPNISDWMVRIFTIFGA